VTQDSAAHEMKVSMRARIRSARADRPAVEREAAADALAARVLELPELAAASCVAPYVATDVEPGTAPLIAGLLASGRIVLLPRVRGTGLEWVSVSPESTFTSGAFGILEPQGEATHDLSDADVVIVPALAVDTDGRRLGQGGGFYDRALGEASGAVIALVFDDEVVPDVPVEPHDRGVDVVVTPSRTHRCG